MADFKPFAHGAHLSRSSQTTISIFGRQKRKPRQRPGFYARLSVEPDVNQAFLAGAFLAGAFLATAVFGVAPATLTPGARALP